MCASFSPLEAASSAGTRRRAASPRSTPGRRSRSCCGRSPPTCSTTSVTRRRRGGSSCSAQSRQSPRPAERRQPDPVPTRAASAFTCALAVPVSPHSKRGAHRLIQTLSQDDVLKVPRQRAFRILPVSMPVPSWCAHDLAMANQPPTYILVCHRNRRPAVHETCGIVFRPLAERLAVLWCERARVLVEPGAPEAPPIAPWAARLGSALFRL